MFASATLGGHIEATQPSQTCSSCEPLLTGFVLDVVQFDVGV